MFHIVLLEPEIPPNTGNIIRLCANTGSQLHLIKPLGFSLDDRRMRRAGLDYHEYSRVHVHESFPAFQTWRAHRRCFALSAKGTKNFFSVPLQKDDCFLFGPETRGIPEHLRSAFAPDHVLRLPMQPNNRSLNLANSAAVVVYEAWRQENFSGSTSGATG